MTEMINGDVMPFRRFIFPAYIFMLCAASLACSRKTFEMVYPTLSDGKYDTEFPYRDCSDQLKLISRSIFKVYCLVDYKTYLLDPDKKLLPEGISVDGLFASTNQTVKTSEASTGTATLIHFENNRIALLTCAHIFSFPDTIFSYFDDNDPYSRDYLEGISVKTSQLIFIRGFPEGNNLEVLASDPDRDLAIIGRATGENISDLAVFPYRLGHSENLEWGSFAYLMGFPMGYQMITKAIVSRPDLHSEDYFIVDAIFNEGSSGSIVLAIMDGVPNFELVGIGNSASVNYNNVLVPSDPDQKMIFNPNVPYDGDIFVNRIKSLNYGVTFAVTTHAIRELYQENKEKLESGGYFFDSFFE